LPGSTPFRFAQLVASLNGGGVALKEVVDMAALGRIKSLLDRYPLSAVKQAYDDFAQGHLVGRAVVIPEGLKARAA
jgi:D-arabinose 1-dehydrogenase-like Zn-dependent alcohol dehydrogenase